MDRFIDARREYAAAVSGLVEEGGGSPKGPSSLDEETVKKLAECLHEAREAIAVDPLFLPSHLLAIQILSLLDRPADCEKEIDYLLGLFPDEDAVREQVVTWEYHGAGDVKKAEAILDEGLERNPARVGFHLLKAELLADSGKEGEEIRDRIRIILSCEDLPPGTWFRLIGLCVHLSRSKPDEELCRPLLELARRKPELLNGTLAWLFAAGMEEAAKGYFLFAAGRTGAVFPLKLAAARLLIRLEDAEEAAGLLGELSKAPSPGKEGSKTLLALEGHLERLRGEKKAALAAFRRVLGKDPADMDALEGIWILYEKTSLVDIDEVRALFMKAAAAARDPAVRAFLREKVRFLKNGPKRGPGEEAPDSKTGKTHSAPESRK